MMRLASLIVFSLFILQAPIARSADDRSKKMPELTKEERVKRADMMDKMAEMHKKMANCLRSDKSMSECHDQMKQDCPMAKEGHCPMMDEMKGMHGRMHGKGKMMKGGGTEPEKKD